MDYIQSLFQYFFMKLYPLVHTHFVSYSLILAINLLLIKFVWTQIKNIKKKGGGAFIKKLSLLGLESILVLYALWFVLIHFHTYRLIGLSK